MQVPAYLADKHLFCEQPQQLANRYLKKGSPEHENSCRKLEAFGCEEILLTDRVTLFGYNMLINDIDRFQLWQKPATQFVMTPPTPSNCPHQWATFRVVNVNIFHI